MKQPFNSNESKLRQAAEFLSAGQKKDARLLIRDVLAANEDNRAAWELLFQASYSVDEQVFCLERLLKLQPNHPWARQQLERVQSLREHRNRDGEFSPGAIPAERAGIITTK